MFKNSIIISLIFCSNVFASPSEIAAGKKIVLEGNTKGALACMTCHMENGEGMQDAAFPQLANMHPDYLTKQLKDLQGPRRKSDVMNPIAKDLSDDDIASVSAYYASMPKVSKTEKSTSAVRFELGKTIAERGLWERGIPACFACHGPNAVGVGESFPPLINQGKLYITQELHRWQDGSRNNDPEMLMKSIAKKLSTKEIDAVAEYLSSIAITNRPEVK